MRPVQSSVVPFEATDRSSGIAGETVYCLSASAESERELLIAISLALVELLEANPETCPLTLYTARNLQQRVSR